MKNKGSLITLVLAVLVTTGCQFNRYTGYVGEQQDWPTAKGGFAEEYKGITIFRGLPSKPYLVIGKLEMNVPPVLRFRVAKEAALDAKKRGADAIIVMEEGVEHVGSNSSFNANTTANTTFTGNNAATTAQTSGSMNSFDIMRGTGSMILIKWK